MRGLAWAAAAAVLSGCFIEPRDARRPAAPDAAFAQTDALIERELAAARESGRFDPARLDGPARDLGLSGGGELIELASRNCLEPRALERFAAARGASPEAAGSHLQARYGVKLCPGR